MKWTAGEPNKVLQRPTRRLWRDGLPDGLPIRCGVDFVFECGILTNLYQLSVLEIDRRRLDSYNVFGQSIYVVVFKTAAL